MSIIKLKYSSFLYYAFALATLWYFLHWLELRFLIFTHGFEIYAAFSAILFTALGIWLANKLTQSKVVIVEKTPPNSKQFEFDEILSKELKISKRELEVLQLMAQGMSNNEIAEALFVSPNTIKTHGARIFEKLDVKRRVQAIEKARRLKLIP